MSDNNQKKPIEVVKLSAGHVDFLKGHSTQINDNGVNYYFVPFWFKETARKDFYEIHRLGNLPKELENLINNNRYPAFGKQTRESFTGDKKEF